MQRKRQQHRGSGFVHRPGRAASGQSLGVLALLLALLLAWPDVARATEPAPVLRYPIAQPAHPLAEALRAIARQTGISVLFDPAAVQGRVSRPVSGQLSAAEAIARVLDGSGLTAEVMPDGAIVVRPAAAPATPASAPQRTGALGLVPGELAEGVPKEDVVRLAQVGSAAPSGVTPDAAIDDGQRIEITGSRLRRVDTEGPMLVLSFSREDIDRSGQPTLERFLASLNEASVSPGEGAYGITIGQGAVQLRGLPLGSTLVLVNGRRVQAVGSSSANFFNLNLIPLAAVERVEVVPVGSSAVYGGDALAGVVNIILKSSIEGQSVTARVAAGRGIGDGSVSFATGAAGAGGSYLLLGSFSRATPLTMGERAFFRDGDYRRFGGLDTRGSRCTPGTVSSLTGNHLPGLDASLAGIPQAAPGEALAIEDFRATAGQAPLCNLWANGNGFALSHGTQSLGLHAAAERRLAGGWAAFGELTLADDRLRAEEIGLSLTDVLVPAQNPYNPFGEAVRVTTMLGLDNGSQGIERRTRFSRALLGLRGELGAGWDLELSASTTRDRGERRSLNSLTDAAARDAALGASSPAAALNPFTTGRAASAAVLESIWSDGLRDSHGRKDQLGAFVRGAITELPAGPLEAIAGTEWARDVYETAIPGDFAWADTRRASAVFGELRAPLLRAGAPDARGWSLAALTLAARRDRYSDFGAAGTWQAGLELRPSRSLLLRASSATSFKPPTMLQTQVDESSFPAEWFGLVDPARGGEAIVSGEVLRTTNTDLGPERGRAHALGVVWEPDEAPGTRLGLTAWRVRIDDLIAILLPQTALDHEDLFPGFVVRGPSVDGRPGPVTRVLYAEVNFGGVDTAGIDLDASHGWRGAAGRWTLGVGATHTTAYRVLLAPGAAAQDRLGRRHADHWAPRWKGRLSATLDGGAWSLGLTSRYLGAYRDAGTSTRRLGDRWLHDLAGSLDLQRLGLGFGAEVKAASLSLAIVNLTNREPQFVETAPYYDVTQADWRGRQLSLRLSVDW